MILYHGSNQVITKIDLSKGKDFKDFGRGFFLTKDYMLMHAYKHDYDIVIGPVADSRVDAILWEYRKSYGDAYAKRANLIKLAKLLKYPGPEYIQYCFCTEKGISQLIVDL